MLIAAIPDARKRRNRALTIVEVCVGVVALATLIGASASGLRAARQDNALAMCQANLGRIQTAALIYSSEDPRELLIPMGIGDSLTSEIYTSPYSFGGRSGLGLSADFEIQSSPFAGWILYRMGARDRPLNGILFKNPFPGPMLVTGRGGQSEDWSGDARWDVGVYNCPADSGFPGMHHYGWRQSDRTSYEYYGTSYAAATLFVGVGSGSPLASFSVYGHAASTTPDPSRTIAYQENAARYAIFANNHDLDQQGICWPYPVGNMTAHGWHDQDFRFNVAFADGSVRFEEIRGYGTQPSLTCAPSYRFCTCVAVRTSAWKLDLNPAPPVVTTKIRSGSSQSSIAISDGSEQSWAIAP
jgi:prepilin-type processing-associated H-X9-DG protein